MSEEEPRKRKRSTTSQVLMKKFNEFLESQKKPAEAIPENGSPSMADQIWHIIPPNARNFFMILIVCSGSGLGGVSLMGIINAQSPVNGHATKTNEILIEIKEGQTEFKTEQKLHSQTIMTIKEDIAEIKGDIKDLERRQHKHE